MIKKNEAVKIKAEWLAKGDEAFERFACHDQEADSDRIMIYTVIPGWAPALYPKEVIRLSMLELAQ